MKIHTVERGESIRSVAELYGVPVDFLIFDDDGTPQQKEFDRLIAELQSKSTE